MFLGNLSTTTERKARKTGGQKVKDEDGKSKSKSGGEESTGIFTSSVSSGLRRQPAGALPLIYSKDNMIVPREVMLNFFTTCSSMILDEVNIEEMIRESNSSGQGLQLVAAEFQRDVMERNCQIERNFGCRYMSSLPNQFPDDRELLEAGFHFTNICQRAYIQALKLRSRKFKGKLRKTGGMSRSTMMEFFEGCNALMAVEDTKKLLKEEFDTKGSPPNQKVIDLQRSVIEWCGIDADYGVSFLSRIATDFPTDNELHTRMQQFALCAQIACNEATMSRQQVAEFYANIPLFMRNFPHMFVFHQKQQMAAQQQEQQQQMSSGPMAQLMGTAEGRLKVEALGVRMMASKTRAEGRVTDMSQDSRKSFYDTFPEHPVLGTLNESNNDPAGKLEKFMLMSDSDLDDLMSIQLILGDNMKNGGTWLKDLMAAGASNPLMGGMQSMQQMFGATHGPAGGRPGPRVGSGGVISSPDVSSGKVNVMDR